MVEIEFFFEKLKDTLSFDLPGAEAQYLMAPQHRYKGNTPSDTRNAAVLLLFYKKNEKIFIPFIKRTADKGPHSKQVSFPGGMAETNDISYKHTALREFIEETGYNITEDSIIGELTELYIPVSNTLVHPFIGITYQTPVWAPDINEVERIIEMPLNMLLNKQFVHQEEWIINGVNLLVPFYNFDNEKIWGATAMILSEMAEILKKLT